MNKKGAIPKHFRTLEEAGEFWDTHDLGNYWLSPAISIEQKMTSY